MNEDNESSFTFGSTMSGFLLGLFLGVTGYWLYSQQKLDDTDGKAAPSSASSTSKSRGLSFNANAAVDANQRSGSFLTDLIQALWKKMNAAVSMEIKANVEPMFKEMLPGPLKTLHFTKCNLGHVPLKLDNCIVHECQTNVVGKDYVQIEIDVIYDGQCEFELKADYLGRFGVQHLKLEGRLSVLLQPVLDQVPVVGAVQYGFVNPPKLELDFTGLASVADISAIKKTINKTIADILAGMMVLPNRMLTKLDENQSYFDAYQPPLGVARLSILNGRGFVPEKRNLRKDDIPDVYCIVSVGAVEIWTTAVVKDNTEPVWNDETADYLLDDHNQVVTIQAFDRDEGQLDSDDFLGIAKVTVGEIFLAGKRKEVELQDDAGRGTGAYINIQCELLKLETKLQSIEDDMHPLHDKIFNGLMTILISKASGITPPPLPKEGEVVPDLYFVKASYGDEAFFTSAVDGQMATYNKPFRVPLVDSDTPPIRLALYKGAKAADNEDDNELVGEFEIARDEILKAPACTLTAIKQLQPDGPSLEYSISICGLVGGSETPVSTKNDALASLAQGKNNDQVAITIVKGWGFKAQKRRLQAADIPDVYCKVTYGASPSIWRTKTQKNNFTPFWEESKSYDLKGLSQVIKIEAWDEDSGKGDADDFLGKARVSVGKVLLAGGAFDVELLDSEGKRTGSFLSLKCDAGASAANTTSAVASTPAPATSEAPVVADSKATDDEPALVEEVSSRAFDSVPLAPKNITVKITAVKGSGFQVEKKRFGRKDIPDVYCKISVASSDTKWRTATIDNNLEPEWNESKRFVVKDDTQTISLEVYDEDSGATDADDFLGKATVPIKVLLAEKNGSKALVLLDKLGNANGCSVTLQCSIE